MKTKNAVHIAEQIWDNSVRESFMDLLTIFGYDWENPGSEKNKKLVQSKGREMKAEIIAKWANIIMEHTHDKD